MKGIGIKSESVYGVFASGQVVPGLDCVDPAVVRASVSASGHCPSCGLRWSFGMDDAPVSALKQELHIEFDCECGQRIEHSETIPEAVNR